MALLIITTILWAFSFSLIGEYLAGSVDSYFSVLMRVGLAALVFLPFLRTRGQSLQTVLLYMLVGAMQLGIMYLFSFRAYIYLSVSEFLLFTVLTPLYITLIYDLLSRRRLRWGYLLSAALAVIGAAIIRYDKVSDHFWTGLMFVQLANISFAIGMVGYKRLMETRPMPQHNAFAWFYMGRRWSRSRPGLFWVTRKITYHRRAVGHSGLAGCGGLGAGVLHVELWRNSGRRRYAGHHEQRARARGATGKPCYLAATAPLAEFPYWGAVILASLWVHRRWVAPRSAQTEDGRTRGSALSE